MNFEIYRSWEESRDRVFLGLLDHAASAKVLDLGCGSGKFSVEVKKRIGCNQVFGVDICEKSLINAARRGVTVNRVDLNGSLPFKDGAFNVVVYNQVIEHLFYPVQFMKEVSRIIAIGGYLIISTENLAGWDNIVALLFGFTPFSMEFDSGLSKLGNPWSCNAKEPVNRYPHSHVRIFAWNGLIELASSLSFGVEHVLGAGHILGKFGENIDKKHCRFIILKLRKVESN